MDKADVGRLFWRKRTTAPTCIPLTFPRPQLPLPFRLPCFYTVILRRLPAVGLL